MDVKNRIFVLLYFDIINHLTLEMKILHVFTHIIYIDCRFSLDDYCVDKQPILQFGEIKGT